MPRGNHSPERTCLGCRRRDAKSTMLRITARGDVVLLDVSGNSPGRGGYLHSGNDCLEKFTTSKVKEFRSLGRRIDRLERLRIVDEVKRWLASGRLVE